MRHRATSPLGAVLTLALTSALALLLVLGGHLAWSTASALTAGTAAAPRSDTAARAAARAAADRPSIVLVLMDDFSLELLRSMPEARRMQRDGATYRNAHVVDSLCCPSRASIFTGQPPHLTGVLTNRPNGETAPIGGYKAFARFGGVRRTFNLALQEGGYTTGFLGKYMNGYELYTNYQGKHLPPAKIPGWDEFEAVLGGGYPEWGFWTAYLDRTEQRMRLRHDRKPPRDSSVAELDRHYATNVIADSAVDFVRRHRDDEKPYFLEVATYGPHAQMTKAYRDNPAFPSAFADRAPKGDPEGGSCGTRACGELSLRDLPGYDDPKGDNAPTYLHGDGSTSPAPPWRTAPQTLTAKGALTRYRDRARMVQSIDRMLARLRAEVGPDTYVVLTSDNGFHLGQHQLDGGKGTPYDSDTHVPLVVSGPGVVPGPRRQLVSSVDLAPTFEELAGLRPAASRAGRSFAETLERPRAPHQRFVFFEHTWSPSSRLEVDTDASSGGDIGSVPSYVAVRSRRGLLARFDLDDRAGHVRYAYELYRYDVPWEDRNVFAEDHRRPWARQLLRRLEAWEGCRPAECRAVSR